jgi:hypothetical protein
MTTIAIVLAGTRPGRVGEAIAHCVLEQASRRTDARFELTDLTGLRDSPPPRRGLRVRLADTRQ